MGGVIVLRVEDFILDLLDEEQRKAVTSIDADGVVIAGAGSGKTRVLVKRFLYLIWKHGVNSDLLDHMVAITFTNKAASEMKERLRQEISCLLNHLERQKMNDLFQQWYQIWLRLDQAQIGTIHSFCQRFIQQEALSMGIDPFFQVIEERESKQLLEQAVREVLLESDRFLSLSMEEKEQWMDFLVTKGWRGTEELLVNMTISWRNQGWDLNSLVSHTLNQIKQYQDHLIHRLHTHKEQHNQELQKLAQQLRSTMEEVTQLTVKGNIKWIPKLRAYWDQYKSEWSLMMNQSQWQAWRERMKEACGASSKKEDQRAILKRICDEAVKSFKSTSKLEDEWTTIDLEKKWTSILCSYLVAIDKQYQHLKRQQAMLDYNDLIRITCQSLEQNETLRLRMQLQIRYLMIDEFQDTDGLQKRLVDLLRSTDGSSNGNLFVVGDPKQSIYRFRGADVYLFTQTQQEIEQKGSKSFYLSTNYRSRPELVDFFNVFFTKMFDGNPHSNNHYQSIRAGREEKEKIPSLHLLKVSTSSEEIKQSKKKQSSQQEAKFIAKRISMERSKYSYGEVVILLRAMTHANTYAQALKEAGIPFRVGKGSSLYQKQEIIDVLYLLTTLVEPSVSAWAGVLRSPFCGLSEAGITQIALLTKWEGSWRDWFQSEEFSDHDRVRLQYFSNFYQRLERRTGLYTVPELIDWLLEESDYESICWGLPDGNQMIANLRKWLRQCHDLTGMELISLEAFLTYMKKLQLVAIDESEANLFVENEEAVRIMTIHQAKGLEFPVVYLPDLDRKWKHPKDFVIHPHYGLIYKFSKEGRWEDAETLDDKLDWEETERLWYVAVTRAEEKCMICVLEGKEEKKEFKAKLPVSYKEWLYSLIPWESVPDEGSFLLEESIEIYVNQKPLQQKHGDAVEQTEERNVIELPTAIQPFHFRDVDGIPINVTEWKRLVQCPRQYFYRQELGMSMRLIDSMENDWIELESSVEEFPPKYKISPQEKGQMVHFLCEKTIGKEDLWNQEDWLLHLAKNFQRPVEDLFYLKKELERMRKYFMESRVYQCKQVAKQIWTEHPFTFQRSSFLISGQIDLLIQYEDGHFELIDFKTDRMVQDDLLRKYEEYLPQLQLYSLAVRKLWGVAPSQVSLFFLDINEEYVETVDEGWLEEAEKRLLQTAQYMGQPKNVSAWATKSGEHCQYCNYHTICDKGLTES